MADAGGERTFVTSHGAEAAVTAADLEAVAAARHRAVR
jgi:hypothetical protein